MTQRCTQDQNLGYDWDSSDRKKWRLIKKKKWKLLWLIIFTNYFNITTIQN